MASAPATAYHASGPVARVRTPRTPPSSVENLDVTDIIEEYLLNITNLSIHPDDHESLDGILDKALAADRRLRILYASDPGNPVLSELHLGLINVFKVDAEARRIRARPIRPGTLSFSDRYIFPLNRSCRKGDLERSTVPNIETFRSNWELFTHGILSKMTAADWKNVTAAGGSVLACLMSTSACSKDLNAIYQGRVWGPSDIDLFIWGLSTQEAMLKMQAIFEVIQASVPWKVTCVRKANTVSIHTTYPYRPVQIVLRLYTSPAEVLAGFDVDAACCAFDGKSVWVNPRSLTALLRQANTVDMTRRSPSYEVRLAKYAERGFEVYIPSFSRQRINPQIYNRDLECFPDGLARLLVLERLYYNPYNAYTHLRYPRNRIESRRELDLGDPLGDITEDAPSLPKSYYEGQLRWIQIPYGVLWDAARIEKVVANKDAWLNSPLNKFNQGQKSHKHIMFAGTMADCIRGNFCQKCSTAVRNHVSADPPGNGIFIEGPVRFLTIDPGCQMMTGSFHPINDEEWEKEAYNPDSGINHEGDVVRVYAMWALLHPMFQTE